ncbi:S-layer homology domain-containing protein [Halobacillus trueperi]|uniref:MBL fold metallo-hydrolase n=1 Tax=Halobacillus trueperi TaxID=156205 RepID=A0A3E0J7L0_9BACI|nr:S-layer homology domain-containing protein [Halobacillus trueperi]REJ08787.1 MBL fold metallo-hydrolase [Halobacillus trueperi]
MRFLTTWIIMLTLLLAGQWNMVSAEETFHDLDQTPWAKEEILYLNDEGIINGYGNGLFGPRDPITRQQAAMMLVNDLYPNETPQSHPDFSDLDKDSIYYEAIAIAEEKGLVSGYPDGTFRGSAPITRAEASYMIDQAYDVQGTDHTATFNDLEYHWAKESIEELASLQIINGYRDGSFQPQKSIIRAEFSVILAFTINEDLRPDPEMTAHFIDVGQGDSTLIETPSGKTILIDGGRKSAGEEVVDYLSNAGFNTIDLLVATHPDADHIGGLIDVMENIQVNKVLDSGKTHTTDTYFEYLDIIERKDIPLEIAQDGNTLDFPQLEIQILNSENTSSDNNESSVVLKASYDEIDFLLMGDATVENEQTMSRLYDVEAEILKVGHHGADTSTSDEFVHYVDPEVGILSYGDNHYGHPESEVTNRLWDHGTDLYSTCDTGDITITTNGTTYDVHGSPFDGSDECTTEDNDNDSGSGGGNGSDDGEVSYPINVNTAGFELLQEITGVGPTIAQNIIDYRNANGPFETYSELLNVSYIGEVTLEEMRPEITLG